MSLERPLAPNPTTAADDGDDPTDVTSPTSITHPEAELWAHLFNVRYRKLLVNLSHVFELTDGSSTREVPTVVRHHHRDHCFTWHAVSGPRFEGSLKLTAVDDRRTRVALDLTAHPAGFMACLTDMVAHNRAQAALDIQRLQSFASGLAPAATG